MAIQQCERCGADLPPTAPGASVTCTYCGAVQRLSMVAAPPAPQRPVDPLRARALFELFVRELRGQGLDARNDAVAAPRLQQAAERAAAELDANGFAEVNLPFIGVVDSGPVHYQRRLTRGDYALGANPFGPNIVMASDAARADARMRRDEALAEAQQRAQQSSGASVFGVIITLVVLAAGAGIAIMAFTSGDGTSGAPAAAVVAPPTPEPPPPPKTPADADHDDAWVTLPVSRVPGDFAHFDGVANLPWAYALAREWAPDATLESFYANGIRADGTADLTVASPGASEPNIDYRFISPARRAQAAQRIQVAANDVNSSFRIWIHAGQLQVMGDVESPDYLDKPVPTPLEPVSCGLDQVLAKMRAGGLPLRPSWDLATTCDIDRHQWSWWIDMSGVGDSTPRVDATTCRVIR